MVFTKLQNQKIGTRCIRLLAGPSGLRSGLRFARIFEFREYHLTFSSFSCQNSREYHLKFPNKSMKSRSKNKKICAVYVEIPFWWFFLPKIQRLLFYIIAFIKFAIKHVGFSSCILILVLYWLNNNNAQKKENSSSCWTTNTILKGYVCFERYMSSSSLNIWSILPPLIECFFSIWVFTDRSPLGVFLLLGWGQIR